MHFNTHTYSQSLSDRELGILFNSLSPATKDLLDTLIRYTGSKIASIKFLRGELKIGLSDAKRLYEGREAFLKQVNDPFGW